MITVRIEYGGMRAERTASGDASDLSAARAALADMFARHGIDVSAVHPLAGRARVTGARVRAAFLDSRTGAVLADWRVRS